MKAYNILITGTSSGIGAALAKAYAKPGVQLFITGRHKDRLQEVTDRCQELGAVVQQKIIDVTSFDELKEWITSIDQKHPIDLVIANAGIGTYVSLSAPFESFNEIKKSIDTNTLGTIATISPFITAMTLRKKGTIVIINSLSAILPAPYYPSYSASKAALRHFSDSIRYKLTQHNVRLSLVMPGFVGSDFMPDYRGPRLFLISPEKATQIIQKGIQKNKKYIIFPKRLYYVIQLMKLLPQKLIVTIYERIYCRSKG